MERRGLRDGDRRNIARSWNLGTVGHFEVHEAHVWCAPTETVAGRFFTAFAVRNENVDGATDLCLVFFERNPVLQCDQSLEALLHYFFRNLVGHCRRRCARANRILECEGDGESCFLDHAKGFLKVLFGFTGESDDDVG